MHLIIVEDVANSIPRMLTSESPTGDTQDFNFVFSWKVGWCSLDKFCLVDAKFCIESWRNFVFKYIFNWIYEINDIKNEAELLYLLSE
jgi:hypothetical protein